MEINLEKNEELNKRNIILSQTAIESLQKTSPWAKFISIIGFILGVFMVIFALYCLISKDYNAYSGGTMCITYLIIAFVCLRINLLLYNYSLEIKKITYGDYLENAFMMQYKFWKYNGILVIIYLSFVLIALLTFIVADIIH